MSEGGEGTPTAPRSPSVSSPKPQLLGAKKGGTCAPSEPRRTGPEPHRGCVGRGRLLLAAGSHHEPLGAGRAVNRPHTQAGPRRLLAPPARAPTLPVVQLTSLALQSTEPVRIKLPS